MTEQGMFEDLNIYSPQIYLRIMKTRVILIGAILLGVGGALVYLLTKAKAIPNLVGVKEGWIWEYDLKDPIGQPVAVMTATVTKIEGSVVTLRGTPPPEGAIIQCDVSKLIDFAGTGGNSSFLCAKGKSVGDDVGKDGLGNIVRFSSSEELAISNWGTRICNIVNVEGANVWYDKETGILVKILHSSGVITTLINGTPG